jgi:hypothetical protein
LAHPAAAAIIPGASRPERIEEDYAALNATVPDDFWVEMRAERLIAPNAPLPIDTKPEAAASAEVPAAPDEVWELIGGFDSLPNWLPYVSSSERRKGGRVRKLANSNGDTSHREARGFRQCRAQL